MTMPPLPAPPADDGGDGTEDSKALAAGEGDAQGDTAGGDDEEASGLVVDGVRRGSVLADDDAVGAAVGVARADIIDQVQVLAAPSPNVSPVLWVQVQRSQRTTTHPCLVCTGHSVGDPGWLCLAEHQLPIPILWCVGGALLDHEGVVFDDLLLP